MKGKQGKIQVICNADVMMEGLDLPSCEAVIIHRHMIRKRLAKASGGRK